MKNPCGEREGEEMSNKRSFSAEMAGSAEPIESYGFIHKVQELLIVIPR